VCERCVYVTLILGSGEPASIAGWVYSELVLSVLCCAGCRNTSRDMHTTTGRDGAVGSF
jgi:hypothetical protein